MCNQTEAAVVLVALDSMKIAREVFTAFDVTKRIRANGDKILHSDVRRIVRGEYETLQMDGYNRELRTLKIGVEAFVYYPDGKISSDHYYVEADPETDIDVDVDVEDSTDEDVLDTDCRCVAKDNRVNVPQSMLNKVDAPAGSYDFMVNGTLVSKVPHSDGRVRLAMSKLNLTGDKIKFAVDTDNNTISIETA